MDADRNDEPDDQLAYSYVLINKDIAENILNQVVYIGQTTEPGARLNTHQLKREEFRNCEMRIVGIHKGEKVYQNKD